MKIVLLLFLVLSSNLQAAVKPIELPADGISPECVTDSTGTAHIVYYQGSPQSGNIFYTTVKKGASTFGDSIRVNSQEGSAVAMGTIRAAQLALGKGNSIHVVWNGSEKAKGQFLYSRSLNGNEFSSQKDMKGETAHIDGGGSVAANETGQVFVVWHGNEKGTMGEENRSVFMALSNDNGSTFTSEKAVSPKGLGICPCCSLKANASGREVSVLFRGAKGANRDVYELSSNDGGKSFNEKIVGKWRARMCPMSSQSINVGSKGFLKAWESEGKIYFSVDSSRTMAIPGNGQRKHPVIVQNSAGNLLVAWTEGTGWNRGGDLCWQEISPLGQPLTGIEKAKNKVKVWSKIGAFAVGEQFFIVH